MLRNKLFGMAMAMAMGLSSAAMAFETGIERQVLIDGEDAGTWEARDTVREDGDYCRYSVKWSNGLLDGGRRTRACYILESRPSNFFDCLENADHDVIATVTVGIRCRGFDTFLTPVEVDDLLAGEGRFGLSGEILLSSSGDLQTIEVF